MPETATLAQVRKARDGRMVEIDSDVLDVCARIREVDSSLGVDWHDTDDGGVFRIYEDCVDGVRRTVKWVTELTADLPDYLRMISKQDYAGELERGDAQADRDRDHASHERLGPHAERLAHAMRKDLGLTTHRIYVPRGI